MWLRNLPAAEAGSSLCLTPLLADLAQLLVPQPMGAGPFMPAGFYLSEAAVVSRVIFISTVVSLLTMSVCVIWIRPRTSAPGDGPLRYAVRRAEGVFNEYRIQTEDRAARTDSRRTEAGAQ